MEKTTYRLLFAGLFLTGLLGSLIGIPFTIAVLMDPAAGGPVDPQMVWLSALGEAIFFSHQPLPLGFGWEIKLVWDRSF